MQKLAVTAVALCLSLVACKTPPPKRPATAVALCEELSKKYIKSPDAMGAKCANVTDPAVLTLLQAVEGATFAKPGAKPEEALLYVSYRQKSEKTTLGGLLQMAARELTFALPVIEASNDGAHVSVWVVRGEISADDFEKLGKDVAAYAGDSAER